MNINWMKFLGFVLSLLLTYLAIYAVTLMWREKNLPLSSEPNILTLFGNAFLTLHLVISGGSLDLFVKASPDGTTGAELSSSLHTFEKGIMPQKFENRKNSYFDTLPFYSFRD